MPCSLHHIFRVKSPFVPHSDSFTLVTALTGDCSRFDSAVRGALRLPFVVALFVVWFVFLWGFYVSINCVFCLWLGFTVSGGGVGSTVGVSHLCVCVGSGGGGSACYAHSGATFRRAGGVGGVAGFGAAVAVLVAVLVGGWVGVAILIYGAAVGRFAGVGSIAPAVSFASVIGGDNFGWAIRTVRAMASSNSN